MNEAGDQSSSVKIWEIHKAWQFYRRYGGIWSLQFIRTLKKIYSRNWRDTIEKSPADRGCLLIPLVPSGRKMQEWVAGDKKTISDLYV